MRIRLLFTGAVLWAVCGACGGRTELGGMIHGDGGAPDSSPQAQLQGIVFRSCAPNDGPAYTFQVGPNPSCNPTSTTFNAAVITVWSPFPLGAGTFTVGDGSFASGSSAFACPQPNAPCVQASGGTLVLTEFVDGTSASGSYTLSLPDGTTASASFTKATFCPNAEVCG